MITFDGSASYDVMSAVDDDSIGAAIGRSYS